MFKLAFLLGMLCPCLPLQAEPLRVCSNEWAPYTLLENGQMRGIDADLLALTLDNLGVAYRMSLEPWRRCLRKMRNGQLDILLDAVRNDERERYLIFPDEPMVEAAMVLFYAKARPYSVALVSELTGLRVGIEPGYEYADSAFISGQHFIREEAPSLEANFGKLLLGRVDLVITDRAVGLYTARLLGIQDAVDYNRQAVYSDPIYAAFSRKPAVAALVPRFEAELKRIKAGPDYARILQRYHQPVAESTAGQTETSAD